MAVGGRAAKLEPGGRGGARRRRNTTPERAYVPTRHPDRPVPKPDRQTARRGLSLVYGEAEDIADNPNRLRALIRRSQKQLRQDRSRLGSLRADIPRLIRLGGAIVRGEYRHLPWKSLVFLTAGLLYFVMPADIIPDFILGTGFLDDAVVVVYVMKAIRDDLERYEEWELQNAPADPETLSPPY